MIKQWARAAEKTVVRPLHTRAHQVIPAVGIVRVRKDFARKTQRFPITAVTTAFQ